MFTKKRVVNFAGIFMITLFMSVMISSGMAATTGTAELKIGQTAPAFTLQNHNGEDVSLSDFKGQWVVLYFYPKADTRGCTIEACGFSDATPNFKELDAVILGVSGDNVSDQKAFVDKYGMKIQLLADPDSKALKAYGVWKEPGDWQGQPFVFANRHTYLIAPDGKIAYIWKRVNVKTHPDEVKAMIEKLSAKK